MSDRRPALLEPSGWLSEPQREIWADVVASAPPGLLKAVDRGVLEVFVIMADLHRRSHDQIEALGLLWWRPENGKDGREIGRLVPSPALAVADSSAILMLAAAVALGFTPASRTKIRGQA